MLRSSKALVKVVYLPPPVPTTAWIQVAQKSHLGLRIENDHVVGIADLIEARVLDEVGSDDLFALQTPMEGNVQLAF